MRIADSGVKFAQRIENTLAPVATRAAAVFREGAQEAVRFQFNMLVLRMAGRIMLAMLKMALPFVVFQMIRKFISEIRRGRLAGTVHAR